MKILVGYDGSNVAGEAIAVAEKQQAAYELAQSALVRARLQHACGMPAAQQEVERAEAELERFQAMIAQSPES